MNTRWEKNCLRIIFVVLILTICLSVVQALATFDILGFGSKDLRVAQNYALGLVELNLETASDFGVSVDDPPIAWRASLIQQMINSATGPDEVYHIIMTEMDAFELRIREHADFTVTQDLKNLIGRDPNNAELQNLPHEISISFLSDNQAEIEGGAHLALETLAQIESFKLPDALRLRTVVIVVDLVDGLPVTSAREPAMDVDSVLHLESQFKFLEQELNSLRVQAGHAEMTGTGLIIELDDAEFPVSLTEIVHAEDLQEIVHTLFSSGARGISVGGKRLTVTSSIRCVGGPIFVNNEPIPGKPNVIVAIGDPEQMLSALESLFDYFSESRGLLVQVEQQDEIHLPAYRRRQ